MLFRSVSADASYAWALAPPVPAPGGPMTLAITSTDNDGAAFSSREHPDEARRPSLLVRSRVAPEAPVPDAGVTPPAPSMDGSVGQPPAPMDGGVAPPPDPRPEFEAGAADSGPATPMQADEGVGDTPEPVLSEQVGAGGLSGGCACNHGSQSGDPLSVVALLGVFIASRRRNQ